MRYVADTPIGSTEFTQDVQLEDKISILLTTEKPIYQPGQTIHVRALALNRADSFAATEIVSPTKLDTEFGRSLPQDKYADYQQRYRTAFINLVRKIAAKLDKESDKRHSQQNFISAFKSITLDNGSQPRDAWNNPLHIEPTSWGRGREIFYRGRSAGQTAGSTALTISPSISKAPASS
jgi:hypothetical protein